jgi:hypothetical protein
MIDKVTVFNLLQRRKKTDLLGFLESAFDVMEEDQRKTVFADLVPKPKPTAVAGATLLEEAKEFHRQAEMSYPRATGRTR